MIDPTMPAKPITIYHIEMRRSLRVIWACEELGIPYELVFVQGDLLGSVKLLRAAHPIMPMCPVVDIEGQVLVESGAIVELLAARYGNGTLVPPVYSPDFGWHLQWVHFAEGTGMARIHMQVFAAGVAGIGPGEVPQGYVASDPGSGMVGAKAAVVFAEDHLGRADYFSGSAFSAADIMMHYTLMASKYAGVGLRDYPRITAWRERVQARPAYVRAMDAALPGGYDEEGNGYGLPIPGSTPPAVFMRKD
jgi:glutathione S-transferase